MNEQCKGCHANSRHTIGTTHTSPPSSTGGAAGFQSSDRSYRHASIRSPQIATYYPRHCGRTNSGCNGGPNTSVWTVPYHNPSYFPAGPVLGTSSDTALPLSTLAYTGYPRLLLYHVRHVRLIDMVVSTCERSGACTRHCGFLATCLVALETVPWPTDTPRGSRPHLVTMLLTGVSSEWRVAQYRGQQCIQSRLRGPILVSNRIPWIGSNLRAETSR